MTARHLDAEIKKNDGGAIMLKCGYVNKKTLGLCGAEAIYCGRGLLAVSYLCGRHAAIVRRRGGAVNPYTLGAVSTLDDGSIMLDRIAEAPSKIYHPIADRTEALARENAFRLIIAACGHATRTRRLVSGSMTCHDCFTEAARSLWYGALTDPLAARDSDPEAPRCHAHSGGSVITCRDCAKCRRDTNRIRRIADRLRTAPRMSDPEARTDDVYTEADHNGALTRLRDVARVKLAEARADRAYSDHVRAAHGNLPSAPGKCADCDRLRLAIAAIPCDYAIDPDHFCGAQAIVYASSIGRTDASTLCAAHAEAQS